MSLNNGHDTSAAVQQAMREAGLHWRTEPVVISEAPPAEPPPPFRIVKVEEPEPEQSRMAPQVAELAQAHAALHAELRASTLHSMTFVFIGLVVGYGLAMAVVYLQGKV